MEGSSPETSTGNTGIDSGSTKTSNKRMKGSKEGGFSCDQCDFTSMYFSNLRQHIKSKHEKTGKQDAHLKLHAIRRYRKTVLLSVEYRGEVWRGSYAP